VATILVVHKRENGPNIKTKASSLKDPLSLLRTNKIIVNINSKHNISFALSKFYNVTNETLQVFDKMLKSILKSQVLQKYIHQNLKIKHILFDLASFITYYKFEHGVCFHGFFKKNFSIT
jgi:hypothetical protein